jgi:hypothetical protein
MHYERAPCFRRLKQVVWRGLRSAALCRATLRSGRALLLFHIVNGQLFFVLTMTPREGS